MFSSIKIKSSYRLRVSHAASSPQRRKVVVKFDAVQRPFNPHAIADILPRTVSSIFNHFRHCHLELKQNREET